MTTPQTIAEKIASRCSAISKWGCLAFTYLWCVNDKLDNGDALELVANAMRQNVIEEDCTVKAEDYLYFVTGRKYQVEKRSIKSLEELKNIKRCAVRFDYNDNSHWVGVENGKVKFNSLVFSACLNYGKPTSARIIKGL